MTALKFESVDCKIYCLLRVWVCTISNNTVNRRLSCIANLSALLCAKEHLDFMNNVGANQFELQPFTQLENDYSGYQSLTDVPKASVYTEDVINIQVNYNTIIVNIINNVEHKQWKRLFTDFSTHSFV